MSISISNLILSTSIYRTDRIEPKKKQSKFPKMTPPLIGKKHIYKYTYIFLFVGISLTIHNHRVDIFFMCINCTMNFS